MVLPPVFDTFDTWDKRPEIPIVGHNTETTIAVMSLGIGMCLGVAWLSILLLDRLFSRILRFLALSECVEVRMVALGSDYLLLLFSPPSHTVTLRI